MEKLTEAWFSFKGVNSEDLEIYMTQMPVRQIPARQLTRTKVAGRSGQVRQTDGSYDDITISIAFKVLDVDYLPEIAAPLTGSGPLIFSDEPEFVYDAVIEDPPQRQFAASRFDVQSYTVDFVCHPFKRLAKPDDPYDVLDGDILLSHATAESLPRVTIAGYGAFTVTIGEHTMTFRDVTGGGVIVDSELGDVLTYDGKLLANNNADGELFVLKPGANLISWVDGGTGVDDADEDITLPGAVTAVTIEPRWRYI